MSSFSPDIISSSILLLPQGNSPIQHVILPSSRFPPIPSRDVSILCSHTLDDYAVLSEWDPDAYVYKCDNSAMNLKKAAIIKQTALVTKTGVIKRQSDAVMVKKRKYLKRFKEKAKVKRFKIEKQQGDEVNINTSSQTHNNSSDSSSSSSIIPKYSKTDLADEDYTPLTSDDDEDEDRDEGESAEEEVDTFVKVQEINDSNVHGKAYESSHSCFFLPQYYLLHPISTPLLCRPLTEAMWMGFFRENESQREYMLRMWTENNNIVNYLRCDTSADSYLTMVGEADALCQFGIFGLYKNSLTLMLHLSSVCSSPSQRPSFLLYYINLISYSFFLHVNNRFMEQVADFNKFKYSTTSNPDTVNHDYKPYTHLKPEYIIAVAWRDDFMEKLKVTPIVLQSYAHATHSARSQSYQVFFRSVVKSLLYTPITHPPTRPNLFARTMIGFDHESWIRTKLDKNVLSFMMTSRFKEMPIELPVEKRRTDVHVDDFSCHVSNIDTSVEENFKHDSSVLYTHIGSIPEAVTTHLDRILQVPLLDFCKVSSTKHNSSGSVKNPLYHSLIDYDRSVEYNAIRRIAANKPSNRTGRAGELHIRPHRFPRFFTHFGFCPNSPILQLTEEEIKGVTESGGIEEYILGVATQNKAMSIAVTNRQDKMLYRLSFFMCKTVLVLMNTATLSNRRFVARKNRSYLENHSVVHIPNKLGVLYSHTMTPQFLYLPQKCVYTFYAQAPHFLHIDSFVSLIRCGTTCCLSRNGVLNPEFMKAYINCENPDTPFERSRASSVSSTEYTRILAFMRNLESILQYPRSDDCSFVHPLDAFNVYKLLWMILKTEDDVYRTLAYLCLPDKEYEFLTGGVGIITFKDIEKHINILNMFESLVDGSRDEHIARETYVESNSYIMPDSFVESIDRLKRNANSTGMELWKNSVFTSDLLVSWFFSGDRYQRLLQKHRFSPEEDICIRCILGGEMNVINTNATMLTDTERKVFDVLSSIYFEVNEYIHACWLLRFPPRFLSETTTKLQAHVHIKYNEMIANILDSTMLTAIQEFTESKQTTPSPEFKCLCNAMVSFIDAMPVNVKTSYSATLSKLRVVSGKPVSFSTQLEEYNRLSAVVLEMFDLHILLSNQIMLEIAEYVARAKEPPGSVSCLLFINGILALDNNKRGQRIQNLLSDVRNVFNNNSEECVRAQNSGFVQMLNMRYKISEFPDLTGFEFVQRRIVYTKTAKGIRSVRMPIESNRLLQGAQSHANSSSSSSVSTMLVPHNSSALVVSQDLVCVDQEEGKFDQCFNYPCLLQDRVLLRKHMQIHLQ